MPRRSYTLPTRLDAALAARAEALGVSVAAYARGALAAALDVPHDGDPRVVVEAVARDVARPRGRGDDA